MLKCFLICCFTICYIGSFAQSTKKAKSDSIQVVITLKAADDKMETAYGYWEARANAKVQMDMFGFVGNKGKHLYKTFDFKYDEAQDAWLVTLPKGYFELRVESLGFTNINFPFRLEKDHREEFLLKVDSTAYTYKDGKKYNYIVGTLNFCETILVEFKGGELEENRTFLSTVLAVEGMEHLRVLRSQKVRHSNAFLVSLGIDDRTPLNVILHRKMMGLPRIERGYLIGPDVTKAIEMIQANPNVKYANPSFLNDPNQTFRKSADYTKSEELERKLLKLMEEDPATLDKINFIIQRTTPKEEKKESDDF